MINIKYIYLLFNIQSVTELFKNIVTFVLEIFQIVSLHLIY
jgi:hypothetical protein